MMKTLQLRIQVNAYSTETELSAPEQTLLERAREATYQAYAPYSRFHVGAAVLLDDGTIFTANNQENAAFPSGSCAEQSAIFWIGANHPERKILSIAVVARPGDDRIFKPVSPCGACRQALLEYEHRQKQPIRLLMLQPGGGVLAMNAIADLLPVKFDADDLFDRA
ncbi:cytidine deaminase [Siphonobacter aquaeclarae]|jgi:cytidine deaminase|uniref:Cytidine deaminase n=1 Tax=Siphonobacter aquaeclarae TaxID=563176 RepID=A0A1G9XTM2_9BACT|nr:cytidine deaminase [Siphonobacter aquaeclarae]SDM99821.1 cytidine deaminase [Siphonobacter aquaeclarae]